jgi:predicted O-linked N-acetylglucosamine transferase (SPINDLY family)
LQRKAAEIWVRETCMADDSLGEIPQRAPHGRIRIGYFSADFREHPVARLVAELIETHDRSRFEVIALSFGPEAQDALRMRLARGFDRFLEVHGKSHLEIAALARSLAVDIAVDLGGYTHNSRPEIFALRAAPIQVGYLGYLGTMGAPWMDYLVADTAIIPAGEQQHYSEKIIYLPSYQVNDSRRRIGTRTFARRELGLPPAGFVFCCLNSIHKITPATFGVWMRIIRRVERSVLFLCTDSQAARRNLLQEAQRRGVDAHRIVFGERLGLEDYLARFRTMDLFLDTLPYNGGTTASDALWAGLPVLTCMGQTFAGRVATSLLMGIDVPELITATAAEYEEKAVELGSNPQRAAELRKKLAANRLTKPLFDSRLFAKHLETAFATIHERYQANLPTAHIHVGFDQASRVQGL